MCKDQEHEQKKPLLIRRRDRGQLSMTIADLSLSSDQAMPSHLPKGRMGPMNGEMGLLLIPAAGIR